MHCRTYIKRQTKQVSQSACPVCLTLQLDEYFSLKTFILRWKKFASVPQSENFFLKLCSSGVILNSPLSPLSHLVICTYAIKSKSLEKLYFICSLKIYTPMHCACTAIDQNAGCGLSHLQYFSIRSAIVLSGELIDKSFILSLLKELYCIVRTVTISFLLLLLKMLMPITIFLQLVGRRAAQRANPQDDLTLLHFHAQVLLEY